MATTGDLREANAKMRESEEPQMKSCNFVLLRIHYQKHPNHYHENSRQTTAISTRTLAEPNGHHEKSRGAKSSWFQKNILKTQGILHIISTRILVAPDGHHENSRGQFLADLVENDAREKGGPPQEQQSSTILK